MRLDSAALFLPDVALFLHDQPVAASPLLKAGFSHVQFETIHPFLDGNGRVGRLLIALILCSSGVLKEPLLYPSLYFKMHRDEYYDRLDKVRSEGEWFCLKAVLVRNCRLSTRCSPSTLCKP